MKAKDVLTWIVNQTITTEGMGFIGIDKDFDFESFFGYNPEKDVPEGEYLYFYGDMVGKMDVDVLEESTHSKLYRIPTQEEDRYNGGKCIIYLIKLEDEQ